MDLLSTCNDIAVHQITISIFTDGCNSGSNKFAGSFRCTLWYENSIEEKRNFQDNWNPSSISNTTGQSNAFTFVSLEKTKGMAFWGFLEWYSAGGYIANLGDDVTHAQRTVQLLEASNWLDEFTRAVFIEFNVYNPNTGLFSLVTLLVEFPPSGGAFPSCSVETVRLYRYTGSAGLVALLVEIACLLCTFVITIREVYTMFRLGCRGYFASLWRKVQVVVLLLVYLAFSLYIYRTLWTVHSIEHMMNNKGNVHVYNTKVEFCR